MPDISKCQNESCPKKLKCWRYTSQPDFWQSYAKFKYANCEYFWDNTEMVKKEREIFSKGGSPTRKELL